MPKIDTTTIDGFEAMDDSQKLAALLELEIPEKVDLAKLVSKAQYDKVASELAEAKRINRSKLTEEEAAKATSISDVKLLGKCLYTHYNIPFVILGFALLSGTVGAVALARKIRKD